MAKMMTNFQGPEILSKVRSSGFKSCWLNSRRASYICAKIGFTMDLASGNIGKVFRGFKQ